MKKLCTLLVIAAIIGIFVGGTVHAKCIEVLICDQCDKQMSNDDDYYVVEHVMSCNNDPGKRHFCSLLCLIEWAGSRIGNPTDSYSYSGRACPITDHGELWSVEDDEGHFRPLQIQYGGLTAHDGDTVIITEEQAPIQMEVQQ